MAGDLYRQNHVRPVARRMSRVGEKKAQDQYELDVIEAEHEKRLAKFYHALALQHVVNVGNLAGGCEDVVIEHDGALQEKTRYLDEGAQLRTRRGLENIEHAMEDGLGLAIVLYATRTGLRR